MYRSSRAFTNYWRTIRPVVTISSPWAPGKEKSDLAVFGSRCSISEHIQIHSVKSKDHASRAATRLACSAAAKVKRGRGWWVTTKLGQAPVACTVSNWYKLICTCVSSTQFLWCILWLNGTSYSKSVLEGTNRNMPARNTPEQLLALYTNPESQNAQHHRQTDRQTTGWCQ